MSINQQPWDNTQTVTILIPKSFYDISHITNHISQDKFPHPEICNKSVAKQPFHLRRQMATLAPNWASLSLPHSRQPQTLVLGNRGSRFSVHRKIRKFGGGEFKNWFYLLNWKVYTFLFGVGLYLVVRDFVCVFHLDISVFSRRRTWIFLFE